MIGPGSDKKYRKFHLWTRTSRIYWLFHLNCAGWGGGLFSDQLCRQRWGRCGEKSWKHPKGFHNNKICETFYVLNTLSLKLFDIKVVISLSTVQSQAWERRVHCFRQETWWFCMGEQIHLIEEKENVHIFPINNKMRMFIFSPDFTTSGSSAQQENGWPLHLPHCVRI